MNLSPRPAVAAVSSLPTRSLKPDVGALLEIVTLRERMTQVFWLTLPFNFLINQGLINGHAIPMPLLFAALVVDVFMAWFACRLVLVLGGGAWKVMLVVVSILLPLGTLIMLLVLRTWAMGFLTASGVREAKAWEMRNQIRRM